MVGNNNFCILRLKEVFMQVSKINTIITLDYLTKNAENLYFERKQGKVSNADLANEIAAMANANGGTIVVGVTDDGVISGFNELGENRLNDVQRLLVIF